MARRPQPFPVHLNAKGMPPLPTPDLHAILRAADELIAVGGRSLLVKILRGSRSQDVLRHDLAQCPAYGFYKGVPEETVLAKIDWMILHDYLRIEYRGQLPTLVFSPQGWDIERENRANEIIRGFDEMLAGGPGPYAMAYLKDRNRGMIMLILDKLQDSGDPKYAPLLDDWALVDYQKVQLRIRQVKAHLLGQA
jgi:hypothetical protein